MKGNDKIIEVYKVADADLEADVSIVKKDKERILTYELYIPELEEGTSAFVEDIKIKLLKRITISSQEALNIKMADELKIKFFESSKDMMRENMPNLSEEKLKPMAQRMVQEMLGLGDLEFLLRDNWIEEICVNGAGVPVWIYHRKYGWIKTNIFLPTESQIWNYASSIARGVGRQINTQTPLLDAYLGTGDRVNATLFPISNFGNTITIRKFARKPWTISDYITTKTISSDVSALLWLAIQYETNMIISGGTGAGKTSLLNVLSTFIPQNQRVVSIEQTREISLPPYLQWIPLVVREATSEGTGAVSMLDLLINSLRMRPDRIIVGEIRRAEEAEVLFEAMHTGHSVYATMHAETAYETLRRITSPPINIAPVMTESLHLIVSMYRDRRSNIRRVFEVAEVVSSEREGIKANVIYMWKSYKDQIVASESSLRLLNYIKLHTNMDDRELRKDLEDKRSILEWIVKKKIATSEEIGDIISAYYDNPEEVIKKVHSK